MEPHGNARKTCLSSRMEWLILPLLLFQVGLAQAALPCLVNATVTSHAAECALRLRRWFQREARRHR